MPLLKLDTLEVDGAAARARASLDQMEENVQRMRSSAHQIAWDAPAAYDLQADLQASCSRLLNLIADGKEMFWRVTREVEQWEQTAGRLAGAALNTSFLTLAGGAELPIAAILPVITRMILPFLSLGTAILDKMPPWLRQVITDHLQKPIAPDETPPAWKEPPEQKTGQIPKSWLEHEQEKPQATSSAEQEKPTEAPEQAEKPEQPAQTITGEEHLTEEIHDVPVKSQQGLKWNGQKTGYGCVPTSASMVTDYWHQQDPSNPTVSAQDLLDQNAGQKLDDGSHQFTSTGMTIDHLKDDLEPLGYHVDTVMGTADNGEAQLTQLKQAVEQGPVVAVVRLGMGKTGVPHAVVVTGFTDDGHVVVNDPYTGSSHKYSVERFDQSWGSDFGKDKNNNPYATRAYTTIQPPSE